jgi:hypothetical protein
MARCSGVIMSKEKVGIGLYKITKRRCKNEMVIGSNCMLHYFKYNGLSHHKPKEEPFNG